MQVEDFTGNALNAVDAKSRLSIPAAFRETIQARAKNRTLFIGPAEFADCLIGFDEVYNAERTEIFKARFAGDHSRSRVNAAQLLWAGVEKQTIDEAGRIVLSQTLKELGNIGNRALFLASGDYFEIWNPDDYLAQSDIDQRMVRIVTRLIGAKP